MVVSTFQRRRSTTANCFRNSSGKSSRESFSFGFMSVVVAGKAVRKCSPPARGRKPRLANFGSVLLCQNALQPPADLPTCGAWPEQPSVVVIAKTGLGKGDIFRQAGGLEPAPGGREVEPGAGDLVVDELRPLGQALPPVSPAWLAWLG